MSDDLHQWVRVEFYGRVPSGQRLVSVDPAETARTLMRAFGYTAIDRLTVAAQVEYGPLAPQYEPGPPPDVRTFTLDDHALAAVAEPEAAVSGNALDRATLYGYARITEGWCRSW